MELELLAYVLLCFVEKENVFTKDYVHALSTEINWRVCVGMKPGLFYKGTKCK